VKRLIEFPLEGGSSITVEVDEPSGESTVRGFGPVEPQFASQTYEAALEKIKPAAGGVIAKLRELADPPDQAVVEFGLKFGAKAGALLASADTEANLLVTLTWKRKEGKDKEGKDKEGKDAG
jgi:hypothetical protein